jgi:hypothetical protein
VTRFRALLAATVLLVGACSQGAPTAVPTLGPIGTGGQPSSGASAVASASAGPSGSAGPSASTNPSASATAGPTAPPSASETGAPTTAPSGSGGVDPTSEDALNSSFLQADDLPSEASGGQPKLTAPDLTSPEFKASKGIRQASATWSGKTFSSLFDIRFQFPTPDAAGAFLDAAEPDLSESTSGLKKFDATVRNADDVRAYQGTISLLGVTTKNFNFLLRVGNFVGKVFIAGPEEMSADDAAGLASAAAARMTLAVTGVSPEPSVVPTESPSVEPSESASIEPSESPTPSASFNTSELKLLQHVPDAVQGGCSSVDKIYATEVDSVRCVNDGQPSIDYSIFSHLTELKAEFKNDASLTDTKTTADGECDKANYEDTYTIAGADAGTIRCMIVTGTQTGTKYKIIEWTNEKLLILSYMYSSTMEWADLISFWESSAGPNQ